MAIGLEDLKSKKRTGRPEKSTQQERSTTTRPWEVADRFEEMSGQYKFRRSIPETVTNENEIKKESVEFGPVQHQTEFLMNPVDLVRATPGTRRGLLHLLSVAISAINPFSFFD